MAKKNKADTQEIELSAKKPRTNANSRGRTSAKAKREAEEKEIQRRIEKAKRRNQRTAIILLAVSVLLFAFVIVSGENVWKFCHDVCMGLFGGWAVLWPILLAAVAVLLAFDKLEAKNIRVKLILLTVVILVACTTVFTYSDIPFTPGLGYINKLGFLYKNGVNTAGAGLCSGIFGVPLIDLFGVVGARIFNTILLIVMIIFLSGLTLNEILSKPAKAAHMVKAAGARHYRERLERREVRRQNIYSNSYDDDFNFPEGTVFSSGEYSGADYPEKDVKESKYEKNAESSPEVKLNLLDKLKKVFHIEDDEELYDQYLEEQGDEYSDGDEPHKPQFSQSTKNSIPKTPEQNPERIYGFSQEARNKVPKVIVQLNDDEAEADNSLDSSADEPLTYEFKLPEVEDAPTYPEETNVAHEDYVDPDKHDSTEIHDCKIEEKAEEHTDSQTPVYSEIKLTKQPIQYEEPRVVKRDANSGLSVPLDTEADILAERQKLAEQALAEREATERQDMANKAQMALYNNLKNDANTYIFPPVTMLKASDKTDTDKEVSELQSTSQSLVDILQSFGVKVSIAGFSRGPSVTRYEITPAPGVKVSKITNLSDDIALNLAATGVRIEAPIPGKAAVGIEVPNKSKSVVKMRELVESNAFMTAKSKLTVTLGKDIGGQVKVADLAKMPHMLIAGTTGSGKSVCINSLIISLIYKASPDDVKLLMIDPKVVELGVYNGIPHLLVPVVTDPRKASGALSWAVTEMLNRYKTFAEFNVRDISGYNMLAKSRGYKDDFDQPMLKMPQIVIIIDELADLMMAAPNEVEDSICRLAQMARAAGMHLVVATQRPTVDVVTGLIKANIPSRIAFAVSSAIDSRTILDAQGAEKLLGQGDMLFSPVGAQKPTRIQGCFVSDAEIESIVSFIKGNREITYDESINEAIERNAAQSGQKSGDKAGGGDDFDDTPENDPVLDDAIRIVTEAGQASTSLLQRKLGLGYARAGRYIDKLEQLGIIGPYQGSKPRQVLMSRAQWLERNMQKPDELVKAELDE